MGDKSCLYPKFPRAHQQHPLFAGMAVTFFVHTLPSGAVLWPIVFPQNECPPSHPACSSCLTLPTRWELVGVCTHLHQQRVADAVPSLPGQEGRGCRLS